VGAIQLLPENEQPIGYDTIAGTPLSDAEVEVHLKRAVAPGAGLGQQDADEDDLRISLAGAHEKTALLWHHNQWMRPHGATPTTHIFKLPLGKVGRDGRIDMSASVENEWLCSRILQAYGLPVTAQLPAGFPSSIAEPILGQLQESAKRLAEMPAK
jgi:serine/threonine-protein kinase HipA